MNAKTITITSRGDHTLVTTENGGQRAKRSFTSMDEAIDYAVTRGDADTICLMNGMKVVFAGWTNLCSRD